MSFMTVGHAYQLLESQGRIIARPQSRLLCRAASGFVGQSRRQRTLAGDEAVDINTHIFETLQASRDTSGALLPQRFPDPAPVLPCRTEPLSGAGQ